MELKETVLLSDQNMLKLMDGTIITILPWKIIIWTHMAHIVYLTPYAWPLEHT